MHTRLWRSNGKQIMDRIYKRNLSEKKIAAKNEQLGQYYTKYELHDLNVLNKFFIFSVYISFHYCGTIHTEIEHD